MQTDTTVSYMERTRLYYRAMGYERDYVWANHHDVPFTRLVRPLAECRIALVTTASPANWQSGEAKSVWSGATSEPPEKLFTGDLAWDKGATHTDDPETFLPIRALQALTSEGVIAGITDRYHGIPTEYSQKSTLETDAPEVLQRCRDDGADAVLLVPL